MIESIILMFVKWVIVVGVGLAVFILMPYTIYSALRDDDWFVKICGIFAIITEVAFLGLVFLIVVKYFGL